MLFLAALVGWRMSQGPIVLPYLANVLEERAVLAGADLSAGVISLDFTSDRGVLLAIENAALELDGGDIAISLPYVSAPIDLMALAAGELRFKDMEIDRATVRIKDEDSQTVFPTMATLMEAADKISSVILAEFENRDLFEIRVDTAQITLLGQHERQISGINAQLKRTIRGDLVLKAEIAGRIGPWTLDFSRTIDQEDGGHEISFYAANLTLGEFMPLGATLISGKGFGIPAALSLTSSLSDRGEFETAAFRGEVSPGWINTGKTVVSFDEILLNLQWKAGSPLVQVLPSRYVRGKTSIPLEGVIGAPAEGEKDWTVKLTSREARFGPSDVAGPPLEVRVIEIDGRADPEKMLFQFDRLSLFSPTATIETAGSFQLRDDGPYLAMAVQFGAMPVAAAKRLWPVTVVPPAREWVIEHVLEGRLQRGRATVALSPPAFDMEDPEAGWSGDDLAIDVDFQDFSVKTIGAIPIIQGLSGKLRVEKEGLFISAKDGRILADNDDVVDVSDALFSIPELNQEGIKDAELDFEVKGGAQALASVLNSEPLLVMAKKGLAPSDVSGSGSMNFKMEFPLEKMLQIEDVVWSVKGRVSDFTISKPIEGRKISQANLDFSASPQQINLKGKGRIDGLAADLDLVLPFDEEHSDAVDGRQQVVINISVADLAKRGIQLGGFVSGPLRLSVDETPSKKNYVVDLRLARISLAQIGWVKEAGVEASAKFSVVDHGENRTIENLVLTSQGVRVEGEIKLRESGAFLSADFDRFQLRPNDRASLSLRRKGERVYVNLKAERLDGRGVISALKSNTSSGADEKSSNSLINVEARVERLIGFNDVVLNNVDFLMDADGSSFSNFSVTGATSGGKRFNVSSVKKGRGAVAQGDFAATGDILRFTDIYKRIRGGVGNLSIEMSETDQWKGSFIVENLSILDNEAIRNLSHSSTLRSGRDRPIIALQSNARGEASFHKMEIHFTRTGDVLNVNEGAMTGASIGGTFTGSIDLATQRLNLKGTFVPIYALNNLFAKIPILGFALGGGSDEGLFGVTYQLVGAISDPQLRVNPVSAIAPGIFRKMFEYQ